LTYFFIIFKFIFVKNNVKKENILFRIYNNCKNYIFKYLIWGLGIGDWGLGIGDWAQSPIPNPQSPIPNPQSPFNINKYDFI